NLNHGRCSSDNGQIHHGNPIQNLQFACLLVDRTNHSYNAAQDHTDDQSKKGNKYGGFNPVDPPGTCSVVYKKPVKLLLQIFPHIVSLLFFYNYNLSCFCV